MNILDMKTLVVNQTLTCIICVIVIGLLWQQNRRRLLGLGYWLACSVIQTLSIILVALRGSIPGWLSIVMGGHVLPLGGIILLYIGMERFFGLRSRQIYNMVLLVVSTALHAYFTFIQLNLAARIINFSFASLLVCLQVAWLALRRVKSEMRPVTRGIGWIFIAFVLLNMARIIVNLTQPVGNDFIKADSPFDILLVLSYQMLFFATTFGLFLIVNHHLFLDLHEQQTALQESETKLRAIFENSVDAIGVSTSKGVHAFVNPAYVALFGYDSSDELIGRPILDCIAPEQHAQIIQNVRHRANREPAPTYYETRGLKKDGTTFEMDVHVSTFEILGEIFTLVIERDITEHKRAERALEKQNRKLQMLHKVALDLGSDLEPRSLLKNILSHGAEFFNADRGGGIYLYHADQNTLRLEAGGEINQNRIGTILQMNQGVAGRVFQTTQPLIVNDYTNWEGRATVLVSSPSSAVMGVPLISDGKVFGVLTMVANSELHTYNTTDIQWAEMFAAQAAVAVRNAMLYEEVQNLATVDELTGLYNRRGFFEACLREVGRSQRSGRAFSTLFVDIDRFKQFNDRYSYEVGDRVLRQVAKALQDKVREIDIVGRYGGEEMVVLLPESDQFAAVEIAERLRKAVEALRTPSEQGELKVTVSIGVATLAPIPQQTTAVDVEKPDKILDDLIAKAGQALHLAKQQGRNRVAAYTEAIG